MDIENEEFNKWFEGYHSNNEAYAKQIAFNAWQASANRDGFVLVEKELTEESINKFYEFWDDGPAVVWNEIIKSQENKDE